MKDVQQSRGNSESKALPFAEKLRATLKEEEEMPRPQKIEHGEATIDQRVQQRQSRKGRGRRGKWQKERASGLGSWNRVGPQTVLNAELGNPWASSNMQHVPIKHFCDDGGCSCNNSASILCTARLPPPLYDYINVTAEQQKQKGGRKLTSSQERWRSGSQSTPEAGGQCLGGANSPKGNGVFGETEIDGLRWYLSGKDSACQAKDTGDVGLIPESGRCPIEGNGYPTAVFLPGEFHGQGSLVGYGPWDCKSWTWLRN